MSFPQIYDSMLGKTPNKHQVTIFQTPLVNFINMDHELVHLAQHIEWDEVENEFKGYFSENGRPSIEPVSGHLKQDHRKQRNYLKGNVGDSINTMMAAAGFNLKHCLNKVIFVFNLIYRILIAEVLNLLTENRNMLKLQPVEANCEKRGVWQGELII